MSMTNKEKHEYWNKVINDLQLSGQSIKSYCKVHDIPERLFYSWRLKIKGRITSSHSHSKSTAFINLKLNDDNKVKSTPLKLELNNGIKVIIDSCFDESLLKRVLEVMKSCSV